MKTIITFFLFYLSTSFIRAQNFYPVSVNGKWGFINSKGVLNVSPEFDAVGFVSKNYLLVCKNAKWGVIDSNGNQVIAFKYSKIQPFCSGLFLVRVDNYYGFINSKDSFVYNPEFVFASNFNEGFSVALSKKNNSIYLLNTSGKRKRIEKMHKSGEGEYTSHIVSEGLFYLEKYKRKKRYNQYYDISGKATFKSTLYTYPVLERRILAFNNINKWGFLDKKGEIKINLVYDQAQEFNDGLAAIKTNGKWGFIDSLGNLKINCLFDEVYSFSEGFAMVNLNGKWIFIDINGKTVISIDGLAPAKTSPELAGKSNIYYRSSFIGNLSLVLINNEFSYIDKTGKIIWQSN
jgi:hypothetical protein